MIFEAVHYPPKVVKANRKKFDRIKKLFVKYCAYKGLLDGFLSPKELENARKGSLPKNIDVHHKKPLSMVFEPNDFENLCIIDRGRHNSIHRDIDSQIGSFYESPYYTTSVVETVNLRAVEIPKLGRRLNFDRSRN